jgi:MFS family permease
MPERKFYYGWVVAVACAIGVGSNFSLLVNATTGIFAGPLGTDLGWSRDSIMAATWYASIPSLFSAPMIGALVDRYGARRILLLSYLAQVLILASFFFIKSNVYEFYARYTLVAFLAMGTTNVTYVRLIALWFNKHRGLALGIVLAGVGIGGAMWSKLTLWLIDQHGWRDAYLWMAGIIALLVLPLVLALTRDRPESMGTTIDGLPPEASGVAAQREASGYSLLETLRIPHYWVLVLSLLLIGTAIQAVQVNMVPLLKTHGMAPQMATSVQASLWIAIVLGRVSTGWFMDRYFAPRVAMCYMIAPLIGLTLFATQSGVAVSFLSAMFMGLAAGAEIDVIAFLVSRYFGLKQYSRVYGTFYATYGIAAAIGPYLASVISTRAGNDYTPALWLCFVLVIVGTALMAFLPRFQSTASGKSPRAPHSAQDPSYSVPSR